jgi:hypothetical protein
MTDKQLKMDKANVVSMAEWKEKRAKPRRRYWVPIPDPNEPKGYRLELALPIEDKIKT